MACKYFEGESFVGVDYSQQEFVIGDYEDCRFESCFFGSVSLFNVNLIDCEFKNCDLSLTVVDNLSLNDVCFDSCKLLGWHFDNCNPLMMMARFINCQLNLSSFYNQKLKNIYFENCQLHEVDFSGAELPGLNFHKCDLAGALFEGTNLQCVDFRTASNYNIDGELNKIKGAKFSYPDVLGLLVKYDIEIA